MTESETTESGVPVTDASATDGQLTVHRVCGVADVPLGEVRRFVVGGVALCVAHCNDGFRAIEDFCSHADYALSFGVFDPETCEIECPQHGSLFSLITGEPATLPATEPVPVFTVRVQGDDVVVFSQ